MKAQCIGQRVKLICQSVKSQVILNYFPRLPVRLDDQSETWFKTLVSAKDKMIRCMLFFYLAILITVTLILWPAFRSLTVHVLGSPVSLAKTAELIEMTFLEEHLLG